MNILFLTTHLNIGGVATYVFSLAKGLASKGHKVYIASSGGDLVNEINKSQISFFPIPIKTKSEINIFKIYSSLGKLLPYIKNNNIELVHSNTRVTQVLGCLIQRYTTRSHIYTCHGFFRKNISRSLFPCWGDRVIAVSEQVRQHLKDDFAVREEKIALIPNGIDLDKFNPSTELRVDGERSRTIKIQTAEKFKEQAKEKLGLGQNPVIGIIARLSDVKGHIFLIKAMKDVLFKIPQAKLLIVGEGKMEEELIGLVKDMKIKDNVKFVPKLLDTKEALLAMDVFVMPSLKEGLGLGLMEAMACGIAVIGSNVGGIKSLIQNNQNGLLVEPMDTQGLSQAILELLQNPGQAKLLGENAGIFIRSNFSIEQMVLKTERVYQQCLSRRN